MLIIRIDSGVIAPVFGALFIAGFFYNLFTHWIQRKGYDEGYTALLVVGGVGMTLVGIALLSREAALIVLGAFSASGFWMVMGSIWRYAQRRERSQQAIIDEAKKLAE